MKPFLPPVLSLFLLPAALFAQGTSPQLTTPSAVAPAWKTASQAAEPVSPVLAASYGKIPLSFEANQGQSDRQVRFVSHGQGYSLFLTDRAAVLALSGGKPADERNAKKGKFSENVAASAKRLTDVVRMELAGAAKGLAVSGADPLPGTANYFIGNDPAEWHSAVPTYAKVKYAGVYPGVDLVYYGNQQQLEYDFVVAPGADPKQVKLHFAGAEKLKLNADGDLTVGAKNGEIAFHKPVVYQVVNGQRRAVSGTFALAAKNMVGFTLGKYDRSRQVVIDPTLAYSTYLGGSGGQLINAMTADSHGNVYVTGDTGSSDFPVTGGVLQGRNSGKYDIAFVTKLNPQGTALVYSTYLGGRAESRPFAIAADSLGNAYVGGFTAYSTDFPITANAFQKQYMGILAGFLTKITPDGSELSYSTYLGSGTEVFGIAVDDQGDAFTTGLAGFNGSFPVTSGSYQSTDSWTYPDNNYAFVTKFNPEGSALIYSTLVGSEMADYYQSSVIDNLNAIALDKEGDAYITGSTASPNYPVTANALQKVNFGYATYGSSSPFVTKLNADGSALVYSTFLGGSGIPYLHSSGLAMGDVAQAIAIDSSGSAYVAGVAASSDFPVTTGAFQTINRAANIQGENAFISKLNPDGSALVYSTYLGGKGYQSGSGGFYTYGDVAHGIAIDASGDAFVIGGAASDDFPITASAFQSHNRAAKAGHHGAYNAFLTELNPAGSALTYSTYLGGSNGYYLNDVTGDWANAIALDGVGNVYLSGLTTSTDFPVTAGSLQPVSKESPADSNGFVAKFDFNTVDFSQGFASAVGPMELNGSADLDGSSLRLTDGAGFEAGSAFYATPVNVQAFSTGFNFKLDLPAADGITFTLQGVGPGALGAKGGGLGYAGLGESVAVKFDLHNNAGEGGNSTGLYQDGAMPTVPSINLNGTGIDLHNRRTFHVHLSYDGTTLTMRLSDPVTEAAFTHSFVVDIPAIVGGPTAYVGFTGGTGKETAAQKIEDWRFTNP